MGKHLNKAQLRIAWSSIDFPNKVSTRRGADKSLARPRRKEATAIKLGIYSTYTPRNSTILSPLLKRVQATQTNSGICLSNQVSAAALNYSSEEKIRNFNSFSVQGTGDIPTGPDPKNRVGDHYTGRPGRPVSSGLQLPGELEHCLVKSNPTWWLFSSVFPS